MNIVPVLSILNILHDNCYIATNLHQTSVSCVGKQQYLISVVQFWSATNHLANLVRFCTIRVCKLDNDLLFLGGCARLCQVDALSEFLLVQNLGAKEVFGRKLVAKGAKEWELVGWIRI